MNKKNKFTNYAFITLFLVALTSTTIFAQAKKPLPVNTKNIKAKGIIAADLDCTVKVNGAAKIINVKAGVASVVVLNYGDNSIEATSTDKKSTATFQSVINVKDTARKIIEISFFEDGKFLDYIKKGNVAMVETSIKRNPDLISSESGTLNTSPLLLAIVNSQPEVVKLLINKGASFTSPENIFPLHKAALYASSTKTKEKPNGVDKELVEYFISKGCKVTDVDDGGNTPLHSACRGIKLDLVIYLIEKGADVNAKNDFGDTPLKIAEDKGAVSIINFLKTKGAQEK